MRGGVSLARAGGLGVMPKRVFIPGDARWGNCPEGYRPTASGPTASGFVLASAADRLVSELVSFRDRGTGLSRWARWLFVRIGGEFFRSRGKIVLCRLGWSRWARLGWSETSSGVYPIGELVSGQHPNDFSGGYIVVVSDDWGGPVPRLLPLYDWDEYQYGGTLFRQLERREDRGLFSYYWLTSNSEPVVSGSEVRVVHVDSDDYDWGRDDDDDDDDGGWSRGIGNHSLKGQEYEGPVLGVELEVDSDRRNELGRLCRGLGVHTCRDGSLGDRGIELVAAPLRWDNLTDASAWGEIFRDGDFYVDEPDEYGIHVSLNRSAVSRGAQARISYALNRWKSLERVFGRPATDYARKDHCGSRFEARKTAFRALRGTGKYIAAHFASDTRLEVRCIAATSDWREFRARVGLVDALRLYAEYTGWGGFTGYGFAAFCRSRLLDSHPETVKALCGDSRRAGRPSEVN